MAIKNSVSDTVARAWFDRYKKEMTSSEYDKYVSDFKKDTNVYRASWKTAETPNEPMPDGIEVQLNGAYDKVDSKICVLCNKEFTGWGNNPEPLSDVGVCCKTCDNEKVIPKRMEELNV